MDCIEVAKKEVPPFLDRMVAVLPEGIAYLDASLVFTFCNTLQAEYFGRQVDEVIGHRLHDVVPNNPEFWKGVEDVLYGDQDSPRGAVAVIWADRPEEGEHHYLVGYIPDKDDMGVVRGLFMTALEITASITSQRRSEKDVARLEEINQTLEERIREEQILVGLISHEVRAPLTTIFGNTHLLLKRLEDLDTASRERALNDIRSEAERLSRLVENMLLLARAGTNKSVTTEPVHVGHFIRRILAERQAHAASRTLTLVDGLLDLTAEAEPSYFEQVIHNLLGNAEKYSPVDLPIEITAAVSGAEVIISVLDRGPGITPAEADLIFQAFYRSPRLSNSVSGAGIGLAVCKLLIQAQSGRIWAQPREGGGAIFAFSLPSSLEELRTNPQPA